MEPNDYPFDWKNKVILVVEDDYSNYKYFEYLLKEVNAEVLWVRNGRDAIETCCEGKQKIDLVLMDILIPFVKGSDATRVIKRHRKDLPVIAISAYDTYDNREQCFIAGCDEYLSKPVLPEKLLETMSVYLEPTLKISEKEKVQGEKPKSFKG